MVAASILTSSHNQVLCQMRTGLVLSVTGKWYSDWFKLYAKSKFTKISTFQYCSTFLCVHGVLLADSDAAKDVPYFGSSLSLSTDFIPSAFDPNFQKVTPRSIMQSGSMVLILLHCSAKLCSAASRAGREDCVYNHAEFMHLAHGQLGSCISYLVVTCSLVNGGQWRPEDIAQAHATGLR